MRYKRAKTTFEKKLLMKLLVKTKKLGRNFDASIISKKIVGKELEEIMEPIKPWLN